VWHDDIIDGLVVARREAEMYDEVEIEVEVALGFEEASLPKWHGSRRNAEVMSGTKTTLS
jgi:hypothetical protein